jgi:N-acyl-D-aspartate/D-glutamate deacylase
MTAFGHVLKRHNAGYFTHLRDESDHVIEAVQEAIDIAETCGIHVEIVHFKCSGTNNWGKAATALDMIAAAKARGVDVDCDAYPYAAGSNPLKNLLPQWVQAGGVPAMLERLKLSETREKIRSDIARDGLNNWGRIPSWDCVQISISPHLPQFAGRTILSLSTERGHDPIDTLCDTLADDQGATRVLVTSISEDDIEHIVASPMALVGSDGNCVAPYGQVGKGMPHPRFYGTFPRILHHYVRERGALPLPLAIRKMTGATARALKLSDRGLLKQGYRADVAIFDPGDFRDRATYADPHQFPSGARTTVIVNGELVVDNAKHTEALPGKVLRRNASGAVG